MKRCDGVQSIFIALVAVLSVVLLQASPPALAAEKEPNIVFILTDDQRLEDIDHMPILQRQLIQKGMLFENYCSNVSLCCPSRTSILRGQYAHNTGVMTNKPPTGGFAVATAKGLENSTIAVWLHEHGYKTALIGKYLNGYPGSRGVSYVPPGWDYWASSSSGNPYSEYNYVLNENGKQVQYGHTPADYGTDVYAKKALEFIKECSESKKPFFIYLAFYAPHSPATVAPRHQGLLRDAKIVRTKAFNEADVSTKPQFIQNLDALSDDEVQAEDAYYRKRLRSLQAVDEAIDAICDTLEKTKQLENTYIVFASDNGFHLGEHRMRHGKQSAYETDIHLPLIVRGPGVVSASRATELVGNIDLAPTFADLCGAKVPDFVDGRSLEPILKRKDTNEIAWRKAFLIEHWRPGGRDKGRARGKGMGAAGIQQLEVSESRARGGENVRIPDLHALRTAGSTYVEYVTGEREYYELTEDPNQVDNLAGKSPAEKLKAESARLQQLSTSTGQAARELENGK